MIGRIVLICIIGCVISGSISAFERDDVTFMVYQFPPDMIPCIDGNPSDWDIVPARYRIGMNELVDTAYNTPVDTKDKDVTVTVGWINGMNRLYFLYESSDDYWRISEDDLINDIFEIVVDADCSGGPVIKQMHPHREKLGLGELHYSMHGVYVQNYHVFTPPGQKDWCFVWGCARWLKRLPYANCAFSSDIAPDGSGKLTAEFWITPYDYADPNGPASSIQSTLTENAIIGLTWGVNDYDLYIDPEKPHGNNYDGQFNLSQDKLWFAYGEKLCAFRLMPLEERFREPIDAQATFSVVSPDRMVIAFRDHSVGNISSWHWDFGDGTSSSEQHPIHDYSSAPEPILGPKKPVILTVSGPDGSDTFTFVYEEVPAFINKGLEKREDGPE